MDPADWYLSPSERGNPATRLDRRHADGRSWTEGNLVTPLVHGAAYFEALVDAVSRMGAGDLLLFVDWRGDPDEHLTGSRDSEVGALLADAARRGVDVRGLVWRSHWDRLSFSAGENRHLGEDINAAGGECVLDMRVRTGGSHHQKFVVLRHPTRPQLDVAFVGGIDLCHSRRDDASHAGDPQRQSMAKVYGPRPPWHDIQLAVRGPAVGDVETVFRERWEDPQALSRSPVRWVGDALRHDRPPRRPLPQQLADPEPCGPHPVQLLRTYGHRLGGYPFAPRGERSVARAYAKALGRAERLVYIEDQYLWSAEVGSLLADALRRAPELRVVAVLPHQPDQDGRISRPPNLVSRARLLTQLHEAGPGRVAVYGVENPQGTPVYVHAKVCVIDDEWASVGSDNFNRRSWTHDSELSAAVAHDGYARALRQWLAREHLDSDGDLAIEEHFEAFAASAAALQSWRDGTAGEARPPGRIRPLDSPDQGRLTRLWAMPLYRVVYDPDGRPLDLRLRRSM
ncbi:phospholipase D family protein [Terrabacter carboxydivorans]|uniref:Phospholipase D-like domain-containing protein n=1 Tax=Terrabacter carboxydivorans TaxID=619730 RepID=A0ABN3L391_9MICO